MELGLGKIEVEKGWNKQGVGTVITKIIIAIGNFFKAPRITGTIAGEQYLWDWYPKLGFKIYDYNKLLMELDTNG